MTQKIIDYLDNTPLEISPRLLIDCDEIERCYKNFQQLFQNAHIYFAIKANPAEPILNRLIKSQTYFDAATIAEIDLAIKLGAHPSTISYGNIAKKTVDIAKANSLGIDLFVFDCVEELEKLAVHAKGSRVFFRITAKNDSALMPLSKKFGNSAQTGINLLKRSKELGLIPYGVSFHVGSQQTRPQAWLDCIKTTSHIFNALAQENIHLQMIDIGGGFPAPTYNMPTIPLESFSQQINDAIRTLLPPSVAVIVEPGRAMVATSGVMESEVVLVTGSEDFPQTRWIFLDCGAYNGLWEATNDSLQYIITTPNKPADEPLGDVTIAGPTCDSFDILYDKGIYRLPLSLTAGDKLRFHNCGAYSLTLLTQFNGCSLPRVTFI